MSNIVIKVEQLSKQYRLGTVGTGSLAHDVNRTWHRIRGKDDPYQKIGEANDRSVKGNSDYVWALQDISFNVQHGEVLGIIGRNGAGKSTLLKILSRTTAPTTGSIKIKGRVASLLEVGTGFHPELSGRENIFLNGAILGMTKREIKSKFDEIVDFAGVERYIDTPVKRYSSGMYVRLAFGVAAHLEPEILIVDEVLAVGDAEFQKKALGKMKDVSKMEGRTVLFVSHNMAAIQSLCNKCMYLKNGRMDIAPGETPLVLEKYLREMNEQVLTVPLQDRKDREGAGKIKITALNILNKNKHQVANLISGQTAVFSIEYELVKTTTGAEGAALEFALAISRQGEHLITVMSNKYIGHPITVTGGIGNRVQFVVESLPLMTGTYTINVMVRMNNEIQDWIKDAQIFDVENGDFYKTGLNMPETHKGVYINYNIELQ